MKRDSEKEEILAELLRQEEARTGQKMNARDKHALMKINKFNMDIMEKVRSHFSNMPRQWLVIAQSILYTMVYDYLKNADEEGNLAEAKKYVRVSVLGQMARIMAMIDAYPDHSKFVGFRNVSHDQFRQLLDEEYKKWLT